MNKSTLTPTLSKLSTAALLACAIAAPWAHAQSTSQPGTAATPDTSNKAMKPPTDAAASQAGAATKTPSKPGAQSGPQPGGPSGSSSVSPSMNAASAGNKAAKPPTDAAASDAGVATKRPAKPGAQSGPMPASAPK